MNADKLAKALFVIVPVLLLIETMLRHFSGTDQFLKSIQHGLLWFVLIVVVVASFVIPKMAGRPIGDFWRVAWTSTPPQTKSIIFIIYVGCWAMNFYFDEFAGHL